MAMLPNVAYALAPPRYRPKAPLKEPAVLTVLERVGQVGVIVIPIFLGVTLGDTLSLVTGACAGVALVLYYVGWGRYFVHGRDYRLLFCPLFGVPIPMAISPVAYFLFVSGLFHSQPMLVAAIVLASGHIPISLLERRRLVSKDAGASRRGPLTLRGS